jgi:hypothetical protein
MTERDGRLSVASMATGKSISSPALASILSGEESATSSVDEPFADVVVLGALAAL